LRGYKDASAVAARRYFAGRVGEHLADFVGSHGRCIAEATSSNWDSVAVVPSSTRGFVASRRAALPAEHPLGQMLSGIASMSGLKRVAIGRGPGLADHLTPARDAFEVDAESAQDRQVLLLDDTWVTGARVRSAAAALRHSGADVVAIVVAGRSVGAVGTTAPGIERWWQWADARHEKACLGARARCCLPRCMREKAG
jgi:hypothetical protein